MSCLKVKRIENWPALYIYVLVRLRCRDEGWSEPVLPGCLAPVVAADSLAALHKYRRTLLASEIRSDRHLLLFALRSDVPYVKSTALLRSWFAS